jgi:hypothetical protein
MTRNMVLGLAAVLAFVSSTALAQSKDFNGTWVPDPPKSGVSHAPTLKITMTAKSISLQPADQKEAALVFNLDGTESEMPRGAKGKAEWKGNKLELTLITPRGPQSMTWWREGDLLVQEMQTPRGAEKTSFKRQPPAGGGGR